MTKKITGQVFRIDPPKPSRYGDTYYRRLHINILHNGLIAGYAYADVAQSYKNYAYWRPIIDAGIGATIEFELRGGRGKIINCDVKPTFATAIELNKNNVSKVFETANKALEKAKEIQEQEINNKQQNLL